MEDGPLLSVIPSLRVLLQWCRATKALLPVGGTPTIVDLYKRSDNRFEPMERYFGVLRTAWGSWPVDSVYRTRNGVYEWRYEGDLEYELEGVV